jgi:SAM-dependent methyltransferase
MSSGACKICGGATREIGAKKGRFVQRDFHFVRCGHCGFVAVTDPCTDSASLYDERYYRGEGADPRIDYANEFARPDSHVRTYEWRGIVALLRSRVGDLDGKNWLDYGCGTGGLIRYANRSTRASCVGFDTGAFADKARATGVPILLQSELTQHSSRFDIVTLVEVIEHVSDPVALLRDVAALMKDNGVLFLTTGNAAKQEQSFFDWSYVVPEIHISYFTPLSLAIAYEKAGLAARDGGYGPGWTDIIRFKLLKGLGVKTRSAWEALLPWPLLGRVADRRLGLSSPPLGIKRAGAA